MPSPYRSPATRRASPCVDAATELGAIVWGASLVLAWLADLTWLTGASLKGAPIALDLALTAFLVLVTGATIRTERYANGAASRPRDR